MRAGTWHRWGLEVPEWKGNVLGSCFRTRGTLAWVPEIKDQRGPEGARGGQIARGRVMKRKEEGMREREGRTVCSLVKLSRPTASTCLLS